MTTPGGPAFDIPAQVLYREVDGQMVLLDLSSEQYFGLNEVGADIVTRITRRPFDEALSSLTADYEVEPATLQRDVDELVDSLLGAGLLERVPPA
jgi:Coenzyme PQQ synthesis protein D (PqqD)